MQTGLSREISTCHCMMRYPSCKRSKTARPPNIVLRVCVLERGQKQAVCRAACFSTPFEHPRLDDVVRTCRFALFCLPVSLENKLLWAHQPFRPEIGSLERAFKRPYGMAWNAPVFSAIVRRQGSHNII
jgi:hypothetical protein